MADTKPCTEQVLKNCYHYPHLWRCFQERSFWNTCSGDSTVFLKQALPLAKWFLQWRVFTHLGEEKWVLPFYYFNSPIQRGNFRNAFQQMHLSHNHHKVKALLLCNQLNREIKGRWCWPNFGSKPRCFILHLAEQPHCLAGRREIPN